jgi:hypothetical protein
MCLYITPRRSIEEVKVVLHEFLTHALESDEWSDSRSGHFTRLERAFQYTLQRKLGGHYSRPGCGGEEKNPILCRKCNIGRPSRGHWLLTLARMI